MIWLISGAGRKVGKTTLAFKLLSILPNSLYAKLGHGDKKSRKPDALFHDDDSLLRFIRSHLSSHQHLIIESNRPLPKTFDTITIFIDGKTYCMPPRKDKRKLKAAAHIMLSGHSSVRPWLMFLNQALSSFDLAKKICVALLEQKFFLMNSSRNQGKGRDDNE